MRRQFLFFSFSLVLIGCFFLNFVLFINKQSKYISHTLFSLFFFFLPICIVFFFYFLLNDKEKLLSSLLTCSLLLYFIALYSNSLTGTIRKLNKNVYINFCSKNFITPIPMSEKKYDFLLLSQQKNFSQKNNNRKFFTTKHPPASFFLNQ